jgi:hypothetical protein
MDGPTFTVQPLPPVEAEIATQLFRHPAVRV